MDQVAEALANAEFNDDDFNLQLAAELGKTLLERNQELEESVRKLQAVIEHQSQEIEFLTAQTVQLRDANEARLRIYETLEQSVAELERTNRSLQDEGKMDKKRMKALCASLELVEQHCEELQEEVDMMRVTAAAATKLSQSQPSNVQNRTGQTGLKVGGSKRRSQTTGGDTPQGSTSQPGEPTTTAMRNSSAGGGSGSGRRGQLDYYASSSSEESSSHTDEDEESGIHGSDESDFAGFEDTPLELQEVLRLRSDLARLRSQISREQRVRESLSSELERSIQENARLRDELLSSRERERLSLNIQMEMGGTASTALHLANNTNSCSNRNGPTYIVDEADELCEIDSGVNSAAEQENETEGAEQGNTLLYELDMQYRVLIEKYEALLEARKRDIEAEDAMTASVHSQAQSDIGTGLPNALCDSDTAMAEGIPREESNTPVRCDAACQTEIQVLKKRNFDQAPVPVYPSRTSSRLPVTEPALSTNLVTHQNGLESSHKKSGSSPSYLAAFSEADQETFNKHFEHSPPEYKKLFAEIFAVLKRKVAEMPLCSDVANERQPTPVLSGLESRLECNLEKLKAAVPSHVRFTRSYAEVVRARQQQQQQKQSHTQTRRKDFIGPV